MNQPHANTPSSGFIRDQTHHFPLRVYYEDTDFSGFVYHASWLRFAERARTEFLRCAGIDQSQLAHAEIPLLFTLHRMAIQFLAPAHMDDQLCILTKLAKIQGARLFMHQTIQRGETPLFHADSQIACISHNRPRRIPPFLQRTLSDFLSHQPVL